jgi:hypothetical protein
MKLEELGPVGSEAFSRLAAKVALRIETEES